MPPPDPQQVVRGKLKKFLSFSGLVEIVYETGKPSDLEKRADGSLVGIRKPLAAHEQPIVRTYLAVDDIQRAVDEAGKGGAMVAYGPTRQGQRGTFAILLHGGVQHGLWQR